MVQNSGGNGGANCGGSYSFSFNHAYMALKSVTAGQTLYCQYWSRDTASMPDPISLSDGLRFTVVP